MPHHYGCRSTTKEAASGSNSGLLVSIRSLVNLSSLGGDGSSPLLATALTVLFAESSCRRIAARGIDKDLEAAVYVLRMAGHAKTAEAVLRLIETVQESPIQEPLAALHLLLALAGTASQPCGIKAAARAKRRADVLAPSRNVMVEPSDSRARTIYAPAPLSFSEAFYPSSLVPLRWVGSELEPALRMCPHMQVSSRQWGLPPS